MITAGTHPPISIDLGNNEPGMTLQREVKPNQWIDYLVDGVKTRVLRLAMESQEKRERSGKLVQTACFTKTRRSRYFQIPGFNPEG